MELHVVPRVFQVAFHFLRHPYRERLVRVFVRDEHYSCHGVVFLALVLRARVF